MQGRWKAGWWLETLTGLKTLACPAGLKTMLMYCTKNKNYIFRIK